MGKLKNLAPLLRPQPPRIGPTNRIEAERVRNATRAQEKPWRKWYNLADWKRLRLEVFDRDAYRCQQTNLILTGQHPHPLSPVAHHIQEHKGDPVKFWALDNIQTVAKFWHDSVAQAMERGPKSYATRPAWLKPSLIPVTIVCGPPASGKTHYVREHKADGDLVIDLDQIASTLGAPELHGWDRDTWLAPAMYMRNDMLGALSKYRHYNRAWLIVSAPRAAHRQWWADTLGGDVVLLKPTVSECMAMAEKDTDRNLDATYMAIREWNRDYTADKPD